MSATFSAAEPFLSLWISKPTALVQENIQDVPCCRRSMLLSTRPRSWYICKMCFASSTFHKADVKVKGKRSNKGCSWFNLQESWPQNFKILQCPQIVSELHLFLWCQRVKGQQLVMLLHICCTTAAGCCRNVQLVVILFASFQGLLLKFYSFR